ncbi:MAG: restriction endonuclease PLD domain-containing protein [Ostreibacterium sp.]
MDNHGGNFSDLLDREFLTAKNISVASGYTSLDIINKYNQNFIDVAKTGGTARLLLGMAFYEGLSKKKLSAINSLNEELIGLNSQSGVYVCNGRRFHGKVYHFNDGNNSRFYVGSSNFSMSGLKRNIECTMPIEIDRQKELLNSFLDDLYSPEYSIKVNNADIPIIGKGQKLISGQIADRWEALTKYDLKSLKIREKEDFTISLSELAEKEKSNLNVYFGKGRLNRTTGKISPRPWYEIEIIPRQSVRNSDFYPKGDFLAFTDDGLIIPMRTQGDNYKNLRSKSSLQIFGKWLKGKLEKKECLEKYKPITSETLEEYGNSELIFRKISDGKYFMSF